MKQIQYILCVSLCVVSSIGLWSMEGGLTGAGTAAGAAGGFVGGAGDARGFTDAQVVAGRTEFNSLAKQFMDRLKNAYFIAHGPVDASEPTSTDQISVRITKTYKLFVAALRERVESARIAYSPDSPVDGSLEPALARLDCAYKLLFQQFVNGQSNSTMRDNLYDFVVTPRFQLTHAQQGAGGEWGVLSIRPRFQADWGPMLKRTEDTVNEIAWRYDDLRNRRMLSTHAQAAAYDALQPRLVVDRALADHQRQQQLADGVVTAQLRAVELQQKGDNDIRVQTAVGTALEDARTAGARAVQGDRDTAHAARHGKIIAAGKWMLIAAALSAVGGMGAYFGFRHFFKERPKIIRPQDTSISFWPKKAVYPKSRLDKLILPPALQESVMQKFQGMEFAITKGLPLSNMLFYGPPGVGKSLAAQEFVRSLSDKKLAHHIIIRGPAFQQFKRPGQAVSAIRAIFEAAEHSYKKTKKPTIIDFEEAEILFADRGNPAISTEMSRSTLTTLLGLMNESVGKHVVFIATTNHKNDLDPAFRDRTHISNQILFDVPGQEEREIFLRQYLNDVLVEQGFVVSDEVIQAIPALAQSIAGLSGRQISGMIAQAIYPLLNAGELELTLPRFKKIIADTMANKDSL